MSRNILYALPVLCIALGMAPVTAFADDDAVADNSQGIAVTHENFPDDLFWSEVLSFDTDGNRILSEDEIAAVTELDLFHLDNSKGLEYFTALKKLEIPDSSGINFLDLSHNTALEYLDCSGARDLTELDLTKNLALKYLDCSFCSLKELDLRPNTNLESFNCGGNYELASLELGRNENLTTVDCSITNITQLDVSQLPALEVLKCYNCLSLFSIDLSRNAALKEFSCHWNRFVALDLSSNTALEVLDAALLFPYTITVSAEDRTFDLSVLPNNFDIAKTSNWNGGTVDGHILSVNVDTERVSYDYDCGGGYSITSTLQVENNKETLKDYKILNGENSQWDAGSKEGLAIRGNGELSAFSGVKVDDKLIDAQNYTLQEGSTIVTLKPEYLSTLSDGKHSFKILWKDGFVNTSFSVNQKPETPGNESGDQKPETPGSEPDNKKPETPGNESGNAAVTAHTTKGFVTRLYKNVLDRNPDSNGLNAWVDVLEKGKNGGEEAAKGFIFSTEYINKKTSNDAFVEMLYNTLLNRKSDANGKNAWVNLLNKGSETREGIVEGFIHSKEFTDICEAYGIYPTAAEAFAARLYTKCLGRSYDKTGLKEWANLLHNRSIGGGEAAKGFFLSPEFLNKHLSDHEFVTRCYRTFLSREPDASGLGNWVQLLKEGHSREEILDGFIGSNEYGELCISYGINR